MHKILVHIFKNIESIVISIFFFYIFVFDINYVITRSNINYLIYVTVIDESNYANTYNYSNGFKFIIDEGNSNVRYNCPFIKNMSFSISSNGGSNPVIKINSACIHVNRNVY